jgi:hypothetical protein
MDVRISGVMRPLKWESSTYHYGRHLVVELLLYSPNCCICFYQKVQGYSCMANLFRFDWNWAVEQKTDKEPVFLASTAHIINLTESVEIRSYSQNS